ncbi:(R)-mandelonitrile lyase [Azospirillum endophyticum]
MRILATSVMALSTVLSLSLFTSVFIHESLANAEAQSPTITGSGSIPSGKAPAERFTGAGRVQRWGEAAVVIHPGDVAWSPPEQKHWHGASPTTAMTHIAIAEAPDGSAVDWMEKVSDVQYGNAP